MIVRPFLSEDEEVLREIYLKRGFEGGWRPLGDVVSAVVIADDAGRPIALVAAHAVAEIRCIVDHEWETPAWRQQALLLGHDMLLAGLKEKGFSRVTALLEGNVGRGFAKRMVRVRGWFQSRGIAVEKEL